MIQIEEKIQNMEVAITRFMIKFDVLRQKGLPNPLVINDRLMKQDDYDKKIRDFSKEQVNNSTLRGFPSGKVLYKSFENLFYLEHEVKHIFINNLHSQNTLKLMIILGG